MYNATLNSEVPPALLEVHRHLIAPNVYLRLSEVRTLQCIAIHKIIPKALDYNKRTVIVCSKDLLISEDLLICSFSPPHYIPYPCLRGKPWHWETNPVTFYQQLMD
ncbi:hypothetical protein TNCV_1450091 [Trichonephila clavipes]|nr:hypothetical protein TNCV_1450091 [Trichonephila clavipes]